MDSLAFTKIYNLEAIIAQRADKQSLPCGIKSEMVNPTLDPGQGNCLFQC